MRSFFAFWLGGASGTPPGGGSARSYFAFWMGGASALTTTPSTGGVRVPTLFIGTNVGQMMRRGV